MLLLRETSGSCRGCRSEKLTRIASAGPSITHEMLPKEPYNGRIKLAVKGSPIKARWHVSAKARYGGRELRQAGR